MTSRIVRTWGVFGVGVAVVVAALAWVTTESLALEAREVEGRAEARWQEALAAAVWRMDLALAPILGQEAARAYFHYEPFYAVDAGPRTKGAKGDPGVTVASPLLGYQFAPFRLHFQLTPEGDVSSPQVPPADAPLGANRDEIAAAVAAARAQLDTFVKDGLPPRIREVVGFDALAATVETQNLANNLIDPGRVAQTAQIHTDSPSQTFQQDEPAPQAGNPPGANNAVQTLVPPDADYNSRVQMRDRAQRATPANPMAPTLRLTPADAARWQPATLAARWIDLGGGRHELVLARAVAVGARRFIQGVWVDWERLKDWLLTDARATFAAADLVAAPDPAAEPLGQLLATVPARFVPGARPALQAETWTATRIVLLVAWAAILAAVTAVGFVLRAATDLGERRGRFVSAVTHELRTPLTTFRMYTQMLTDGMVTGEAARAEYLATLRAESDRLARVVESVLIYSRLEEGRGGAHRQVMAAADVFESALPALQQRAADGGMTLVVEADLPDSARLEVDAQAVEQILLNLVDNACKYASAAADRRLHLEARTTPRLLVVDFHDHGPGIPTADRERVFLPFHRAARDAAGPTPGVGLGLSVARGLARALGGDLTLAPSTPGAAFTLTLPLRSR